MPLYDWIHSNLHDLNLDWIIKKIKNVETAEANSAASAADANAAKTAAAGSAAAADNSKVAAAGSATAAAASAQTAQNLVDQLDTTIAADVADWLNTHVTPTSPIVDDTLTIQGAAADAKKTGDKITELKTDFDYFFPIGNNLLPLHDFEGSYRGITIKIIGGALRIYGTSTNAVRAKLSGTYEIRGTAPAEWSDERLTQFTVGETYSMHNLIMQGELPPLVGMSLRGTDGSSVIAKSAPEVTLADEISYAMLYIPSGTTIDVTFVPMFIKGTLNDQAIYRNLNNFITVNGIKNYDLPDLTDDYEWNSSIEYAIKLPSTYKNIGDPTPLIILCHGLSSTITASSWGNSNLRSLINRFAADGYAIIDVNQVTSQDWCNPALIKKYVTALKDATNKYNVTPVIVYGESMGCLIGLWLAKFYSTVKCAVISGLRLDFAARYETATNEQKAIIDTNLGFTNGYDQFIAAGWDVTAYDVIDENNNKICPVKFPPTLFIAGSTDTLTKTESIAKAQQIKRGGTASDVHEYTGDHTAVCYLLADGSYDDALEWFETWS